MATTQEKKFSSVLDQTLGYLNFASGAPDPRFYSALNALFQSDCFTPGVNTVSSPSDNGSFQLPPRQAEQATYQWVEACLRVRLTSLAKTNETFRDSSQATAVLDYTFNQILPAYLEHHHDLLFHQTPAKLFNSFFLARVFETVLQCLGRDEATGIVSEVLNRLNNFLGHRPVAVLEGRRVEPYANERICPVPLYLREAGAAAGPYQDLLERSFKFLDKTAPDIFRAAQFDLPHLEEIGLDPRAYDFDHPINKRPNHHFGHWDEQSINRKGFFCRYLVHEVVLDSLLERVARDCGGAEQISVDELMDEAAIVLVGTILMGSGVTGNSPAAYDSNTSLSDLIPVIAGYRDQFYESMLQVLPARHQTRLNDEAILRQQPFGGARQDINAKLANLRAQQLVNCRLASIYARMGYSDHAELQSQVVPVASARFLCQIDCLMDSASRAIARGDLVTAFEAIPAILNRLKSGIECGAIVDPWNILGFDANYSLFPALENSVSDHRVFELVEMMERIFAICSRLWSEAAARDEAEMVKAIRTEFYEMNQWWRQFAAHEVGVVDAVDADEIFAAAELVAEALRLWHLGGAAAGDIEFWAEHAELFDSPKSYALVIEALMQRRDYNTSMALLIHWLSQSEEIPLQMADTSFHELLVQWISEQRQLFFHRLADKQGTAPPDDTLAPTELWNRIGKCYDFLEANADDYWQVPEFEPPGRNSTSRELAIDSDDDSFDEDLEETVGYEDESELFDDLSGFDDEEEEEEEEEAEENAELFGAAYDEMVYQDSTNDGFEGEVFDGSLTSDDELEAEVSRILDRLEFLSSIANYWAVAATIPLPVVRKDQLNYEFIERLQKRRSIFESWVKQAAKNRNRLKALLHSIDQSFSLPRGGSDYEAMLHYDQLRLYKDTLLEQVIHTSIETDNANRMLQAVTLSVDLLLSPDEVAVESTPSKNGNRENNGSDPLVAIFAAILLQDLDLVRKHCETVNQFLAAQTFLYVPIGKGGNPESVVKTRSLQISMLDLMRHLPSLGLFTETYELINTILQMERLNSVGNGAVTEFDELFEVAFTSMVIMLIDSTNQFKSEQLDTGQEQESAINSKAETLLFNCTERLVEAMLALWLDHSQTLRISVLEKVRDSNSWERLVEFIRTYGEGLFTQQFLHIGNIRGILHQGAEHWLKQLQNSSQAPDWRLLDELDERLPLTKAVRYLTLVLEAVLENYNEYRDYNSTTTQSDHGNCLHMFLDFLRLRSRYDRVCWNLKPVIWAHSIFVTNQENNVARRWRRSLTERLSNEAEKYLTLLERLRQKYAMRMESVGRRLEGRFAHQMQIDRLCALVAPAMENPDGRESQRKFELLRQQAQAFTQSTNGVGIDLPAWLAALENEVDQFQILARTKETEPEAPLPQTINVPISQLQTQLMELPGRPLFD